MPLWASSQLSHPAKTAWRNFWFHVCKREDPRLWRFDEPNYISISWRGRPRNIAHKRSSPRLKASGESHTSISSIWLVKNYLQAIHDDVIPLQFPILGTNKREIHVKAGQIIHIPVRDGINVDEAIWGADVAEYKPERWLEPGSLPPTVESIHAQGRTLSFSDGWARVNSCGKCISWHCCLVVRSHVWVASLVCHNFHRRSEDWTDHIRMRTSHRGNQSKPTYVISSPN